MGKFEEFLDKAKDLAEEASDKAKDFAEDVVGRARGLKDDDSKFRGFAQNAKEQASAATLGAKEKVQGVLQDARAAKELKQGITELEELPEFEGSIIYKMELESAVNYLSNLRLIINDGRLDDASVVEEVRRVIAKVQPETDPQTDETEQQKTDEQKAIDNVRTIAYSACIRALEALKASAE